VSVSAVAPAASADDESGHGTRTVPARDQGGHVRNAEMAARELGAVSLSDALALVLLYQRERDAKFERAARRWVRQIDRSLRHREVELLRGAMGALGTRFDSVALDALLGTCRKLRLPLPPLPP
jgi:hypothetical protein